MKSKEAIRKDIIHYANLVWDVNSINNMSSLLQLMIEEMSHELFLLDNKLGEIDYSVLCKLAERLSPATFNYVRPSHAILKIDPAEPVYKLDKHTGFILKQLPEHIKNKRIASVSYTSVTDIYLHKIKITHCFFYEDLWYINETGEKRKLYHTFSRLKGNTIWFGLDIDPEIKVLKDIAFYLSFDHLPDHHEYYDILHETQWHFAGKELKVECGFSDKRMNIQNKEEKNILDLYDNHFYTVKTEINLHDFDKANLPDELTDIVDSESLSLPSLYWISIVFSPEIQQEDLSKLSVLLNAFPVIDRNYNVIEVSERELDRGISLSSAIGQEFLSMESVIDSAGNLYHQNIDEIAEKGEYNVIANKRKNIDNPRIIDYLERLSDIIHDERSAFSGIDNERVIEVLNSIYLLQDQDTQRIELNRLNESSEVALLTLRAKERVSSVNISYWTTHANLLNGIPAGAKMMANKIPELNKSEASLLTQTTGGRSFFSLEDLKAINSFYLTSKDRILTKYNILGFCQIEIGKYVDSINVVRKAVISNRSKEGIVIVMEIQIVPKPKHIKTLNQRNILRSLLVGLSKRSPGNFSYKIVIQG